MWSVITNIIGLGIINAFAMIGIMFIYGVSMYWEREHILLFPPILIPSGLILLLLSINFCLLYMNTIPHYKWPLKKKIFGGLFILIGLFVSIMLWSIYIYNQ